MTTDPTIACPKCNTNIPLTESLAAPLIQQTRQHYEQLIAAKDRDIAGQEAKLRDQQTTLAKEKSSIDQQVSEKLQLDVEPQQVVLG
jgi:hypothetical protein